ncbi:uncharacterized protein LOC143198410 [Rhynchophorus ferrugineus]|uniref:uncharacterized protein LOC143198410 n=1 Tax=Rhynchophorus ferrugineus TaxID=354439 RepID=UPI003FCC68E0
MACILPTFLTTFVVCAVAFEDFIYVYGKDNREMMEQGRAQYQVIKERGTLPKYGPCWKAALDDLNEGCRYLSEDTQSDIAMRITNCFLEMSGHETYNCEHDKKENLRRICINSMTDRAFNVYTEFYTHTQNICWFLRGQIWHETIAENTLKVGKQLELSAKKQEDLIKIQKESIELQEKMMKQGRYLENVLKDVYVSTQSHKEIIEILSRSITNLQSWIVGEISWIDSIIFNVFAMFLIFMVTSSRRTISVRLPLFFLLFLNLLTERLICSLYTKHQDKHDTRNLYSNLYDFVWYSRYAFTFLGAIVIVYSIIMFKDVVQYNMTLLNTIQKQNSKILESVENIKLSKIDLTKPNVDYIKEDGYISQDSTYKPNSLYKNGNSHQFQHIHYDREGSVDSGQSNGFHSNFVKKQFEGQNRKYNLRSFSRHGTPDSGVVH